MGPLFAMVWPRIRPHRPPLFPSCFARVGLGATASLTTTHDFPFTSFGKYPFAYFFLLLTQLFLLHTTLPLFAMASHPPPPTPPLPFLLRSGRARSDSQPHNNTRFPIYLFWKIPFCLFFPASDTALPATHHVALVRNGLAS